jgi:hypothetical protein
VWRRGTFERANYDFPGPFAGKPIVPAILERDGAVRRRSSKIIEGLDPNLRRAFMRENVEPGAKLMTDMGATRMTDFVLHFIDHAEEYVRGKVHANGVENFWSLLRRGLSATYVSVEPHHLRAYVDEQAFRFNERKDDEAGRFVKALSQVKRTKLDLQGTGSRHDGASEASKSDHYSNRSEDNGNGRGRGEEARLAAPTLVASSFLRSAGYLLDGAEHWQFAQLKALA